MKKWVKKVLGNRINILSLILFSPFYPFLQQLEVHCLFERATLDLADNTTFFQLQRYFLSVSWRYGAVSSLLSVILWGYKVAQLKSSNLKTKSCYICGCICMCIYICITDHPDLGNHRYCVHFLALAVDTEVILDEILCWILLLVSYTNFKPHGSF